MGSLAMQTVRDIFTRSIRPLPREDKLELASLILEDVTQRSGEGIEPDAGDERLRSLFGSVSLGHPTGADNVSIDEDLQREYSDRHEGER